MKHLKNKRGYKTTALLIGLMLLLSVLSAILFVQVEGDVPMYEEGADYERN